MAFAIRWTLKTYLACPAILATMMRWMVALKVCNVLLTFFSPPPKITRKAVNDVCLVQYAGIIDFDAMPGFGFNWRSPLSSRFERSIRLMILPPFPTFGFTYSSRPMVAPSHQEDSKSDEFEGQQDAVDDHHQRSNPKDHAADLLQKFDESRKNVEDRKQVEEERARLINALQQFGKDEQEHEKQQQTSKPDNSEVQVQAKEESTTTAKAAAEETVEEVVHMFISVLQFVSFLNSHAILPLSFFLSLSLSHSSSCLTGWSPRFQLFPLR